MGQVASGGSLSGSAFPVKFGNSTSVVVPVGEEVLSDPVPMSVAPLEDLAVSVYLPDPTGPATYHYFAQQSNYLTAGDHVTDTSDAAFRTRTPSWYFLDGLEVLGAYKRAGVVVAYGDSITDGIGSAGNLNDRWPDFLARRLDSRYGNQAPAVIDEGIGGNRVLNPSACYGQSAVTRFSRDVLDQTGVRAVIVLEGINDIGYSEDADRGCERPNTNVSAAQIIGGYKKMIAAAHSHGVKIFGATMTPFGSAWIWSIEGQAKWQAVNNWIRTSGAFNGVFDFARAVAAPNAPALPQPARRQRGRAAPQRRRLRRDGGLHRPEPAHQLALAPARRAERPPVGSMRRTSGNVGCYREVACRSVSSSRRPSSAATPARSAPTRRRVEELGLPAT